MYNTYIMYYVILYVSRKHNRYSYINQYLLSHTVYYVNLDDLYIIFTTQHNYVCMLHKYNPNKLDKYRNFKRMYIG